jgi:ubiquinone/menaquinone biosynthesis C-methylase UbiE
LTESTNVQEHYSAHGLSNRVEDALRAAGFGDGPINWQELASLDQFHVRGLAATKELAEVVGLKGGETVLDVGSGLGGPARYLAAAIGCRVTGIELSQSFVDVANMLSGRTGLSENTTFLQGDATELPFPADSFDNAFTQHVAMNIADKPGLYAGIFRILKSGGKLAIYDVVRGDTEPVIYPVPWASTEAISFLASRLEVEQALNAAGFAEVSTVDTTDLAVEWLKGMQSTQASQGTISPSLALFIGPEADTILKNLAQNIREGRVRLLQVIARKI